MAKVIAPFQIRGTLDELNFVVTADGNNYVRLKGKTGVTAEEFKNNPIYDPIRSHSQEFAHAVKTAKTFRLLAAPFNALAKDGSYAGRVNKLLLEILAEDRSNPKGQRTVSNGLKTIDGKEALLLFESNKLRPMHQVLKTNVSVKNQTLTLTDFCPLQDIDWPEGANQLNLSMLTVNWDIENESFASCYSNEIQLDKTAPKQTIVLSTDKPIANHLQLTFLFIGFAYQQRKKYKLLHRKNNTATLIAYHH